MGTLRSDNGNGRENVKKAIGLIAKTKTLQVHHGFLYVFLPSLHDYNVKMPNVLQRKYTSDHLSHAELAYDS